MNYLLFFVVLCFLLSGCATTLGQVGKADSAPSLKAGQTPQFRERGSGGVSARVATSNAPPETTKASISGPVQPDQF